MPKLVVMGAVTQCTMGAAPGSFIVTPEKMVTGCKVPAANIMDFVPMKNIMTFGMCKSPSNPVVAAATAAAAGVLTPMPCIPATVAPWSPGASKTKIKNMPALHDGCTCNCMWAGTIKINSPGQGTIDVT